MKLTKIERIRGKNVDFWRQNSNIQKEITKYFWRESQKIQIHRLNFWQKMKSKKNKSAK